MTRIVLYPVESSPGTIRLRDPTVVGGGFPTQYAGLRVYDGVALRELCLVAEIDAPPAMGAVLKLQKGGTLYAVYLVETTDPQASRVRIRTTTGTKSLRLKT